MKQHETSFYIYNLRWYVTCCIQNCDGCINKFPEEEKILRIMLLLLF